MNKYELEKWIWTDQDFDQLSWHNCLIYATAFRCDKAEFVLDIDYNFKFVTLPNTGVDSMFWVSPATLVFKDVCNLKFDFEFYSGLQTEGLEIDEIENQEVLDLERQRLSLGRTKNWIIAGHYGEIEIEASGFTQYIRQAPQMSEGYSLGLKLRGGYSFDVENSTKPKIV